LPQNRKKKKDQEYPFQNQGGSKTPHTWIRGRGETVWASPHDDSKGGTCCGGRGQEPRGRIPESQGAKKDEVHTRQGLGIGVKRCRKGSGERLGGECDNNWRWGNSETPSKTVRRRMCFLRRERPKRLPGSPQRGEDTAENARKERDGTLWRDGREPYL